MYGFCFFMIKPDAVRRQLCGKILAAIESEGFEVTKLKMIAEAVKGDVLSHYAAHVGRDYFKSLVESMDGQRLVVGTLVYRDKPEDSVDKFRRLVGTYSNPEPGTLRARFAQSERENAVHGADSPAAAFREANLWFPGDID